MRNAITSILNQTHSDFELIIVDDHSEIPMDGLVKSFGDSRIKYLRNETNLGPGASRNRGIDIASGDWICFLDSDDEFLPNYLNDIKGKIKLLNEKVGFLWTGILTFGKGNRLIGDGCWKPKWKESTYLTFLHNIHIGTNCGICVRRDCFEKVRFDDSLRAAEDTEFFLRLTQFYDYTFVDKNLVKVYKNSPDRVTRNYDATYEAYKKIVKLHSEAINSNKYLKEKYFRKLFRLAYYNADKKFARKLFGKIKKRPDSIFLKLIFEILPTKLAIQIHQFIASIQTGVNYSVKRINESANQQ